LGGKHILSMVDLLIKLGCFVKKLKYSQDKEVNGTDLSPSVSLPRGRRANRNLKTAIYLLFKPAELGAKKSTIGIAKVEIRVKKLAVTYNNRFSYTTQRQCNYLTAMDAETGRKKSCTNLT